MHTTRRRSIVVATITTILLAACGGGTATSGPGGPGATSGTPATQAPGGGAVTQAPDQTVDACALLTAADIEAGTGLAAKPGLSGPQGGIFPSGCLWELVDDDSIVPPEVTLGVISPGGRDYYDRYFAGLGDPGYEPIEGLGDLAVDAQFGAVLVVSGDVFFQVQYIGGGFGDDDTAVATKLSRKVIANLGN